MLNLRNLIQRLEVLFGEKSLTLTPRVQGASAHYQTFSMTLRDGRDYAVRVRNSCSEGAGNCTRIPHHNMLSEYATVIYVSRHTTIPVPMILGYEDGKNGNVGAEWLVEELVSGIPLREVWSGMTKEQRKQVFISIADIWVQLLNLRFGSIGSLLPASRFGSTSFVGPISYMPPCNIHGMRPPPMALRGPFSSAQDWLLAIAKRELDFARPRAWTREELAQIDDVVAWILAPERRINNDATSVFALEHIDLHPYNIRMDPNDPTKVAVVTGWEGARIVPLFAATPEVPKNYLRFDSPEEETRLTQTFFDRITLRVPDWDPNKNATRRELRRLYTFAQESFCYRLRESRP